MASYIDFPMVTLLMSNDWPTQWFTSLENFNSTNWHNLTLSMEQEQTNEADDII